MKKGKLGEVEICFINNSPSLTNEEIAAKLDRSVATVRKNRVSVIAEIQEVVAPRVEVRNAKASDFYLDKVCPKKDDGSKRGIAIATQATTEMNDEFKSKIGSGRYAKGIGKVFPD